MRLFWAVLAAVAIGGCGRAQDQASGHGFGGDATSSGGRNAPSGGRESTSGGDANASGGAGGSVTAQCQAGTVHTGDVYLNTQTDVDLLDGVSQVQGSLYITGDVADLEPLGCLREVTGNLTVYEAKVLKDLAGLDGLTTIGEDLTIGTLCHKMQAECVGNPALENISALRNLTHVQKVRVDSSCDTGEGGQACGPNSALVSVELSGLPSVESLELSGNPELTEVIFGSLARATSVLIHQNPRLSTLHLPKLVSVEVFNLRNLAALERFVTGTGIEEATSVELSNTGLRDLTGFNLGAVTSLQVTGNPQLSSLEGLEGLKLAGSVVLDNNTLLTSLEALGALERIEHDLYVINSPSLASLAGLHGLRAAERLFVDSDDQLTSLAGLSSLATLGQLDVSNNPQIDSLRGLESLTELGSLSLRSNAQLFSLEGLEGVDLSASSVQITDNPKLISLEGLGAVTRLGSLEIQDNPKLIGLSKLQGLTQVIGDVDILRNNALQSLNGLNQLSHVGNLTLGQNGALLDLGGLDALETVDSTLLVFENGTLASISALKGLVAARGLEVRGNPHVATCAAERLRSQLGDALISVVISGNDDHAVCAP